MSEQLFVYGTLRKALRHPMHQHLARYFTYVDEGRLLGEMYDLGTYPGVLLVDGCKDFVIGEVYAVVATDAPQAWHELEQYEGCSSEQPEPRQYDRVRVAVVLADGKETETWTYALRCHPIDGVRIPGGNYVQWQKQARME